MATLLWAAAIFVLAVMIRLPNLYESFWVDELHTAWCIWGDLDQVSPRAAAGNQTPLYFHLMWFWKAIVGESELALRFSSVFAVAIASVLLFVGVQQTTKSLAAGVLSGLILAVETNSIYFGTEFRPYAFVMLLSAIATWSAVCQLGEAGTNQARISQANLRLLFVIASGLAALLHPTALVTFGLLAFVVLALGYLRSGFDFKFQISDIVSLMVIAAVAFTLVNSSLGESWENRSRWAAFGKVMELHELWIKWPWLPIVIIPGLLQLVGPTARKRIDILRAHLPMVVGVLGTAVFFFASYFDWVPLWHRRYFIAVLPMLAWSAGACAMLVLPKNPSVDARRLAWLIVFVITGMLFWQQGSWQQFQATQTWGETRGEDWRKAVAWVNRQREADDWVYVDGDLIEQPQYDLPFKDNGDGTQTVQIDKRWEMGYFKYPVSGCYPILESEYFSGIVYTRLDDSPLPDHWIVTRDGRVKVQSWIDRRFKGLAKVETEPFGRILVYRIQTAKK